jgi:uncharacterized membrane protein YqjE
MTDHVRTYAPEVPPDASTGELFSRISEQTSRLIRDELRLAQLEMTEKGKKAGLGVGLFGGAGVIAAFGLGCLIAAAVLALALAVAPWLAALIVGLVLMVVAGAAALVGKKAVGQAAPPVPAEAIDGIKQDVHTLRPGSTS